ncbi:hypothetical protein P280DRAFT_406642, partial [Massarina eburnea CBS 473.64]
TYIIEAISGYTESAGAASNPPRNIFAFVFPIFAASLYNRLGYSFGNTVGWDCLCYRSTNTMNTLQL